MLGKILGHIIHIEAIGKTEEPHISSEIQEIEFDEMWHFIQKKSKLWIIKALDRNTGCLDYMES